MDDLELQLFRLRVRTTILERMFLKLYAHFGVCAGTAQTFRESLSLIAGELDKFASASEITALSSAAAPKGTSDAERALYADEFREICDDLKSYLISLASAADQK